MAVVVASLIPKNNIMIGNNDIVGNGMNAAEQKLKNFRNKENLILNITIVINRNKTTDQLLINAHKLTAMAMGYF
jgi:hypothetical protein